MKHLLKISLFAFLLLTNFVMFAQGPGDTGDGSGGLEGGDPPPAPIDGKLIYLAIVGILFVAYVYKKNRKTV